MSFDTPHLHAEPPARILCQHEGGSCAACCGLYNFRDRNVAAERVRLRRRTERTKQAWPDPEALAAVRDELLALERPDVLFDGVKVCPFAGYVDDDERRVGCMLHPSRHPEGADLRDLAVYPREVCAGHFCAPHDWLRPREIDLAQTETGTRYGRVVTDAGLVKALVSLIEMRIARPLKTSDIEKAKAALAHMWDALFDWPWTDPDPNRFGGFQVAGPSAVERSLPSCLAGMPTETSPHTAAVLDAVGSIFDDLADANKAIAHLGTVLDAVADAMDRDTTDPLVPLKRAPARETTMET